MAIAILIGALEPAAAEGLYCPKSALLPEPDSGAGLAETLVTRCRPGDIILLDARATGLIGEVCDFSQSIVTVPTAIGPRIMCVMISPRQTRME